MILNTVIIWGIDNFNTLGLLRQLAPSGIRVFFLIYGKRTGCASASKWCKEYTVVNTISEGASYLFSHFANESCKPIIVTPGDGIIEFIDQNRIEFQKFFLVPGTTEPGLLTRIDNKNVMVELAKRVGFTVPQSMVCRCDSDISSVVYPCILKPSHVTEGRYNEFKYKICRTEAELQRTLKFVNSQSEFVLQQYIPKERDFLVYGCRLKNGKCLFAGSLVKDRFAGNGDCSHGLLTINIPTSVNIRLIERFMDEIDYHGLFSVEYGFYNETAFFFEVNLRNDGTSHYFLQAGANMPLAWVMDLVDIDISAVSSRVTSDKWFIDEIADFGNVLAGRVKIKQWRSDRSNAKVFKYYDENDLQPWKNMKRGRWKTLIMNTILSKYRLYIVYFLEKLKRR